MADTTTSSIKQGDLEIASSLVNAARSTLTKIPPNNNHSVVAAARTKDNKIITAFNVYHFTGGPCAEPVVFGAAAAQGYLPTDLTHIVAVANRTNDVISPCGKCRQMILDYCPEIEVVVLDGGTVRLLSVEELMPFAYVNNEGLRMRERAALELAERKEVLG
jgi:cytidine deaminase